MDELPLHGKTILVTGAARRVGRILALACVRAGADVVIHHGHSAQQALDVQKEIAALGRRSWILASDLSKADEVSRLISQANESQPVIWFGELRGDLRAAFLGTDNINRLGTTSGNQSHRALSFESSIYKTNS